MRKIGLVQLGLTMLISCTGCMTGPTMFERHDKYSSHPPGSDAWWAEKAALPPGVRQEYKKGKIWPARPRSTQEPQQFTHTYHSEHYWPLPYVCQDRQFVYASMEQQVALGWQEETTLYSQHFDDHTHQLNRAGQLQLDYLLHVIPPERRAVYIQSTYDGELDAIRLEAVQAAVAQSPGAAEQAFPIELRNCQNPGRPAAEVALMNSRYVATIPAPRIGGVPSGGGGGGGGIGAGATATATK